MIERLDIAPDAKDRIVRSVDIIREFYRLQESGGHVYLYGSYAKGTAGQESDIDILVVLANNHPGIHDITAPKRLDSIMKAGNISVGYGPGKVHIAIIPEEFVQRVIIDDDLPVACEEVNYWEIIHSPTTLELV